MRKGRRERRNERLKQPLLLMNLIGGLPLSATAAAEAATATAATNLLCFLQVVLHHLGHASAVECLAVLGIKLQSLR